MQEPMRTIGFICPSCHQAVIVERSVFQLAAAQNKVDCPCGAANLEVELLGEKVRLHAPCLFCEETHTHTCSTQAFLHEKAIAFSCGPSGLDCCYVGEREPVFAALSRLEETVDQMEEEIEADSMFLNPLVMQEILEELRTIGQNGGLSCNCGNHALELKLSYSSVELSCSVCGGSLKIPAATMTDVEDLCCKPVLTIRGRKS